MNTLKLNLNHRSLASLLPFALITLLLGLSAADGFAVVKRWNGGGGNDGWETSGNWSAAGVPAFGDDVVFGSIDSDVPAGTINNVVSNNLTIRTMWYTNVAAGSNNYHTTLIPAGGTLSVLGTATLTSLLVGSAADSGISVSNYTTFKGAGTLSVSNATGVINVRQGGAGGSANVRHANLDLSGLDTFNAVASQLLIAGDGTGTSGPFRLEGGSMTLARTNIVALTSEPGMVVGGYTAGNLCIGTLNLGQTNLLLHSGTVYIGTYRSTGTVKFNPANANPVVVIRNLDGVSRAGNWIIGDGRAGGAPVSRPSTGLVDLSGGTVDGFISQLLVGRSQNYNTAGTSLGVGVGDLVITKGVLDVTTLRIGERRQDNGGPAQGTVTVGNTAQLIIAEYIEMGNDRVTTLGNLPCFGTLNITNGGFVWLKGDVYDSGSTGTNAINVTDSHLKIGGRLTHPSARPNDALNLTNATLSLALSGAIDYNNPVGSVTNLNIATALMINVGGSGFGLGQYPLIRYYSGAIGGDGYPVITLGTLPVLTGAYLSNNTANTSIDLVVTNAPTVKWNGNINGDWDTNTTANWLDYFTLTPTNYLEDSVIVDSVIFDDSASGTTVVNLTTNLSPARVDVNNSSLTYIFNGVGSLGGGMPLIKSGSGLLVITNAGSNYFTGPVAINGGTVQLGLASNRLPATANVTLANVSGALLDLNGQNQTLNSLGGGGSLGGGINLNGAYLTVSGASIYAGNIDLGAGTMAVGNSSTYSGNISGAGMFQKNAGTTLTMAGSNSYSGGTILVAGANNNLINTSGSGMGIGPITVGSGLILNVGLGDSGGLASTVNITNAGTVNFNATNDTSVAGIHGGGTVTKANINTVTITGPSTFTTAMTISDGAIRIANGDALGSPTAATAIGTGLGSRLELMGNITVPENFSISQKSGANANLGASHFLNVSDINTLTGTITGGSGGSYWVFRSAAGKMIVNGTFVIATTGFRYVRMDGAGDGDWMTPYSNGSGTGRMAKFGTGTWTLSSTNTYTGDTAAWGGLLLVNGMIQSPGTVLVGDVDPAFSGTLGGTGVIHSAVYVDTNGIFAPGMSIGTMTITNTLTMAGGSSNIFEVNTDTLEHDLATGMTSVAYGGTLVISPVGSATALTNGASFQIFSAGSYSGAFGGIVGLPPLSAPCLAWDTNQLAVNGTLGVVAYSLTANTVTYQRNAGLSLKIHLSQLLTNVSPTFPLINPTITLVGVGTDGSNLTTTNGATLSTNATFIGYTNSVTPGVADSFSYQVTSADGCTTIGTILIQPAAVNGVAQGIASAGPAIEVTFSGVPGYQYDVERADDVDFTVNLTTLITTNAPTNGQFGITDPAPPTPTAFYRLKYNP